MMEESSAAANLYSSRGRDGRFHSVRVVERRRRDVVNSRYRTGRKFPGREAITPRGAREKYSSKARARIEVIPKESIEGQHRQSVTVLTVP